MDSDVTKGTQTQWVVTESFYASGSDGKTYQVIQRTQQHLTTMLHGPVEQSWGLREYRLANGNPVNDLGDGRFEVVGQGVTLVKK